MYQFRTKNVIELEWEFDFEFELQVTQSGSVRAQILYEHKYCTKDDVCPGVQDQIATPSTDYCHSVSRTKHTKCTNTAPKSNIELEREFLDFEVELQVTQSGSVRAQILYEGRCVSGSTRSNSDTIDRLWS